MKSLLLVSMALAFGEVHAQDVLPAPDILRVLESSQQKQLDAMTLADAASPRARVVRESFDKLLAHLDAPGLAKVELRVVRGDVVGETLKGHIVVANIALADLPEGERIFVLAHELGHVVLDHWAQMGLLYARWVPGPVEQRHTDAIAAPLGRDGSALAYRQEFDADAFALGILRSMGLRDQDAFAAFMDLGWRSDTATHPGTRKRLAALRARRPD